MSAGSPAGPLLVALDIDGTTLTHAGELRPAVREAVAAVADAGHHVVIATGRSVIATTPVLDRLGITTGHAVCSNGAVSLLLDPDADDGYRFTEVVTFEPGPTLELLREKLPSGLIAAEVLGRGFKVNAPFPDGELQGEIEVVDWADLVAEPVTRITLREPSMPPEEFLETVHGAGLHGVTYSVGWSSWLDINPEGVSKGSALERLRDVIGVDPANTVAVGDQRNDVEMLRWAGRGVAMGNAPDEVKAVADEVCGHVDDDGLAEVLRSLL